MTAAVIGILVFALDRISKIWIDRSMTLYESIPVVNNVFHITYVRNPGGAFGLLASRPGFFILANLVIIALLIYIYREMKPISSLMAAAVGLLIGGALGNLYDRILYGTVIDFLDFRIWPVFNVADIGIVVGAGLLTVFLLREGWGSGEKKKEGEPL
jgi:signal peptidase II